MSLETQIQVFILSIGSAICLLIAFFSLLVNYRSKIRKVALIIAELSTSVLLTADALTYLFEGDVSSFGYWLARISNFLVFFMLYVELSILNMYFRTYFKTETKSTEVLNCAIHLLSCIGLFGLFLSQITGLYYSFDENNNYVREPMFMLSFAAPLVIIVMLFMIVLEHRKELSKHILAAALIYLVLPVVCAILQVFMYGISLLNLSIGISAITLFALSLIDQNEHLRRIACTDNLTGVPNAYGFLGELGKRIGMKTISDYTAFYFDVIRMGLINRKYGNVIGDQVIHNYVKKIQEQLAEDEVLGRLGGNFFVAIIRNEHATAFRDSLKGVEVAFQFREETKTVTIAAVVGIYEIPDNNTTPSAIMSNVSMAVNIAKNIKKKPYIYLSQELLQEMNEQKQMQELIPRCVAKKEFENFYQPKVDITTNTLCGAEALARWNHKGEFVPPYKFIPLMEQNEYICEFDFYMLHRVCADIKDWLSRGFNPPTISVNFSRKNLGNPILAEAIFKVVKSYDIPLELVQIEITETVDEYPLDYLKGVVEALQRYGLTVAIDDFGTGSSSIRILKEVHFDVLKIDKSFIDSIETRDRYILAHIIGMANEMGASIITEGVESKEQIDVLMKLGCKEIQGFYFDKALPKDIFEERMKNPVYSVE